MGQSIMCHYSNVCRHNSLLCTCVFLSNDLFFIILYWISIKKWYEFGRPPPMSNIKTSTTCWGVASVKKHIGMLMWSKKVAFYFIYYWKHHVGICHFSKDFIHTFDRDTQGTHLLFQWSCNLKTCTKLFKR